jgi:glycosyl transferase family 25
MQVHVINLKEAVERRNSITSQLQKLGLQFEIFDAIRGSLLSEQELAEKVDMNEVLKYPKWLTRNMLGASLSHMGVYKRIVSSGVDWHLVLEDDVVLNEEVQKLMQHIEKHTETYREHLVLFYGISIKSSVELESSEITHSGDYHIHKVLSKEIGGAGAYMIHCQTAEKLLKKNMIIKVAPDTWHFFLDQGAFKQIDCVCPFAARPGLFESTIGYVDPRSIIFRIKKIIEIHKIPFLYHLLKRNRRKVWESTSNITFK